MTELEEVVQQLKELNATARKQLEISGLEFALEPFRYIARKLRTGEAIPNVLSYYQLIVPAGVFTVTFANPTGYVWIGIFQSVEVSQNAVFEFTGFVDDEILPKSYVPRMVSHVINWSVTIPFGHVIKETTTLTFVNHDIAAQWISVDSMGIYLRKDVWERDSALMDVIAERYMHPGLPPAPPPPPY